MKYRAYTQIIFQMAEGVFNFLEILSKRPAKYRCTGCDFFGVVFLNRGWQGELVVEPILPAHRCLGGKVTEFCCCGTAPYAAALAGADGTTAWAVVF